MTKVKFYPPEAVEDALLQFAVIAAKSGEKWVLCKHRERDTYEFPGGRREPNEAIMDTACRELYEETGALQYKLTPVCAYSVTAPGCFDGKETFGLLSYAEIKAFESVLHSKIEKIILTDEPVAEWTYPEVQPLLLAELKKRNIIS